MYSIPLGDWITNVLNFLTDNLSGLTKAFSDVVGIGFNSLVEWMNGPNTIFILVIILLFLFTDLFLLKTNKKNMFITLILGLIITVFAGIEQYTNIIFEIDGTKYSDLFLIVLFTLVAWRISSLKIAIYSCVGLLLIWNMGLWSPTITTIALVLIATVIAMIIGLPLGIFSALNSKFNKIITPVLDFMQTMPAFVYLIPAIPFFGLGPVAAVFATVIFSIPPAIRLTALGINQVPEDLIEAADAFGSTKTQKLFKVQLPLALPTIMAGVNQTIMLALSMVVIASMIGAKGLGGEVWKAIQRLKMGMGFEAGIGVVIIAMFLDRVTQHITKQNKN